MKNILKKFSNVDDGIESLVIDGDKGLHVVLRDTDANETVGVVFIFKQFDAAVAKAKSLVVQAGAN